MHINETNPKNQIKLTDDLMKKIAYGDEKSFATLYNITKTSVYSYILAIVKSTHLAEDFMQDTYISIRKNISQYTPMKKPMAWIFTIARNHINTYFRKQKNIMKYNNELSHNIVDFSLEKRSIENIILQSALQTLNEDERIVIILNAVNGYKFREIAMNLQISLGTVLSRYHRGIVKLKNSLREVIE